MPRPYPKQFREGAIELARRGDRPIAEIAAESNRRVYGAPRIHAELKLARNIKVSRKRVERLMARAGISGLVPKRRGRTTIRVPGVRVADDLVERRFRPAAPNTTRGRAHTSFRPVSMCGLAGRATAILSASMTSSPLVV